MKRLMTMFLSKKMILGTMMVITSKHWFLMWMGLEIKTLSMMPMMMSSQTTRKTEATMKYFVMKAMAAAIMLKSALMKTWETGSWLMKNPMKNLKSILMMSALSLKMSLAPFHLWFPDVMSGVKLMQGLMLTTWQKMAPTMMMLKMMKKMKTKMIMMCTMMSVMVGSWGGLNQTKTRKMMAYSSMTHMGWIMLMGMFNQEASLMMFTMYMMMKTSMFILMIKKKMKKMKSIKKNNIVSPWMAPLMTLSILSLGGLPPFTGFMKKFISLKMLIKKKAMLLTIPLITGSLMSLFFYLRMAFKSKLMVFPKKSLLMKKMRKKKNNPMVLTSTMTMITLGGLITLPTMMSMTT